MPLENLGAGCVQQMTHAQPSPLQTSRLWPPCRVRFLTLNRAFLAVASDSTSLWQDLSFTLQAPGDVERLARWLAGKRQRLGALHIRVQKAPEEEDEDPPRGQSGV